MDEEPDSAEPNLAPISVKLKLVKLDGEKLAALNDYFNEYAKAVNFCELKMQKIRKNLVNIRGTYLKEKKAWINQTGECCICKKIDELRCEDKNPDINGKICKKCYNGRYGNQMIRKLFVSTNKRAVPKSLDIRKVARLHNTHYHRIPPEAADIIKAIETAERKRRNRILFDERRYNELKDALENEEKRVARPKKPKEREVRYVPISKKDTPSKGYTMNALVRKVSGMAKKIERAKRNLNKRKKIEYLGRRILLDKNWVRFDFDKSEISIPTMKEFFGEMRFEITGPSNVMSPNGREYFTKWFDRIKAQPDNYCYLLRKESEDETDFYLQYTWRPDAHPKKDYTGCLGIDIGGSKLASAVYFDADKNRAKQPIQIFSNPIGKWKTKRQKVIKVLSKAAVRHKTKKLESLRNIEPRIDVHCHRIARKIVGMALAANAFISMENLEGGIREKQKAKETKKQKFSRNMFVFRKLSKLIEYKALMEGVKVVYIVPDYTSQLCSSCGTNNTKRPKQAIFMCQNTECRYFGKNINADFNAAINIAKKALNRKDIVRELS